MSSLTDKLRQEIKEKQAELYKAERAEAINGRREAIKELSEFTIEEKVEVFDELYRTALLNLSEAEENGTNVSDDDEHYSWERHMEILVRNKVLFWKYWNSLPE